jgi:hypothetical protein
MLNPDFDPLKILHELSVNQAQIAENQHLISEAFKELVMNYNEINRRLCITENELAELKLNLANL